MRIKHKGLRRLAETGSSKGINAALTGKLSRIVSALSAADQPSELNNRGWRLHPMKGNLAGYWSLRVTGNWRVVFRFQDGEAVDVDLVEYH